MSHTPQENRNMGHLWYDEEAGRWTILGYAIFVLTGGLVAWYRRGSRASLVSSSVSTVVLLAAFVLGWWFPVISFAIGAIVALNLAINFAVRLQATRKFMPAGMLMLISLGVFIFLVILAARAPVKGLPDANKTLKLEQPDHALTLPAVGLAQVINGGGKGGEDSASLHPKPETVRRLRWEAERVMW